VNSVESMMMHGLANPKSEKYVISKTETGHNFQKNFKKYKAKNVWNSSNTAASVYH
jgi:hypothetical protein